MKKMKYNKCMDFKVSIARGDEYKSTFTALKLIEDDIVSNEIRLFITNLKLLGKTRS